MPLYEYACGACGHADTLLEKVTAAQCRKCPACGKRRAFERQLSAPAFHLKGSGWYATDFRNPATTKDKGNGADKSDSADKDKSDSADKDKSDSADKDKGGTADKGKDGTADKGKDGTADKGKGGTADKGKPDPKTTKAKD